MVLGFLLEFEFVTILRATRLDCSSDVNYEDEN